MSIESNFSHLERVKQIAAGSSLAVLGALGLSACSEGRQESEATPVIDCSVYVDFIPRLEINEDNASQIASPGDMLSVFGVLTDPESGDIAMRGTNSAEFEENAVFFSPSGLEGFDWDKAEYAPVLKADMWSSEGRGVSPLMPWEGQQLTSNVSIMNAEGELLAHCQPQDVTVHVLDR